jgi:hypothetical protein
MGLVRVLHAHGMAGQLREEAGPMVALDMA